MYITYVQSITRIHGTHMNLNLKGLDLPRKHMESQPNRLHAMLGDVMNEVDHMLSKDQQFNSAFIAALQSLRWSCVVVRKYL